MNYSDFDLENNYLTPDNNLFIYQPKENLTSIGVFISSLILSIGGFISLVCKINKEKKDNISNKV